MAERSRRVSWGEQGAVEPLFRSRAEGMPPHEPGAAERAYRAPLGASNGTDHWDPYNVAHSRVTRVRSARRKARPSRPFTPGTKSDRPPIGPDYYAVLGVSPSAGPSEIERAYKRLVADEHPDRFFNDPAAREAAEVRLREANAAARVLRDPEQRARYDELR